MPKKKFLLVSPSAFNLHQLIARNLAYLGYEVTHIENDGYEFTYRSFSERAYNFFRKVFLGDKSYKSALRAGFTKFRQWDIFKNNAPFDYTLVIRPDLFDRDLIESIRQKSELMIGFQFDGISRNPEVLCYIPLFDSFYVFDEADVHTFPAENLYYSPNFYIDYPDITKGQDTEHYSVYYVSTFHESRVGDLISIHRILSKYYDNMKFCVLCPREKVTTVPEYIIKHMDVIHEAVNFEQQLIHVAHSEVIVDLVIADHQGFSFRIMEGIKFGKKVITTNDKILEAEFYHPNNFHVLRGDNTQNLEEFLKKPYVPMSEEMRLKYGFRAWLESKIKV